MEQSDIEDVAIHQQLCYGCKIMLGTWTKRRIRMRRKGWWNEGVRAHTVTVYAPPRAWASSQVREWSGKCEGGSQMLRLKRAFLL